MEELMRKLLSHSNTGWLQKNAYLGTDHKKSYGGWGWGIFEPQEFFTVIKFLV